MADRTRAFLRQEFSDGERPTGDDFRDLIDSSINKEDDNVRLDTNNNLSIPNGVNLGDAATGQPGTLRFNGGQVQVFDGGAWNAVSGGGGGAFQPVGGGTDVAFGGGNVGVGNFAAAPTHKLDVELGSNTGTDERVRMGQMVVHNGNNDGAHLSHEAMAGANDQYALRQDDQGNTNVNAGNNAQLVLSQQNTPRVRITALGDLNITPNNNVFIAGNTNIGSIIQQRSLNVFGQARKTGGGAWLPTISDERVKRDVKKLDLGLKEIKALNPVYYKFNGKAGTPETDEEYVGLIAQQVEKVMPFLVCDSEQVDTEENNLLTYDPGPLTYVLVKAVQELSARVEQLEKQLKGS